MLVRSGVKSMLQFISKIFSEVEVWVLLGSSTLIITKHVLVELALCLLVPMKGNLYVTA